MKKLKHRELMRKLFKVTQLVTGGTGIQTEADWPSGPPVEMFTAEVEREGTGEAAPPGWVATQQRTGPSTSTVSLREAEMLSLPPASPPALRAVG